jgi:hypothetical protein
MARTTSEISQQIKQAFMDNEIFVSLFGLDTAKTFDRQFSGVSVISIIIYIVAYAHYVLERIFDTHRSEVESIIADMKPHTLRWYGWVALRFRFGSDLLPDSTEFNNLKPDKTPKTDDEIAAEMIVRYVSVVFRNNKLLIKAATEDAAGNLQSLNPQQMTAFQTYMEKIKDAGVRLDFLSEPAENLKLNIDIYYNPLVLNADGSRVDGTNDTPVVTAIKNYLKNIRFDGMVILAHIVDELQKIEGITIPEITQAAYRYGQLNWITFETKRQPISGYMIIDEQDINLNYIPFV